VNVKEFVKDFFIPLSVVVSLSVSFVTNGDKEILDEVVQIRESVSQIQSGVHELEKKGAVLEHRVGVLEQHHIKNH
jgi:uncharacterized protein with PhoU and TrkA domain